MFTHRKLKAKIKELELALDHSEAKNRILKNCANSLCAEIRRYKYGKRAINHYRSNVGSL